MKTANQKTAPSSVGKIDTKKQYFFPELRNFIEGRIEETKVDTLVNRIERELMRRQHLCNEQALMLQMLMNCVQDLEKHGPPKRNSGARARKVQGRVAYGYPERVTEEKKVSALLSRKIVSQQIEFLPPIPEPYAKKRPRDTKKAGWYRV